MTPRNAFVAEPISNRVLAVTGPPAALRPKYRSATSPSSVTSPIATAGTCHLAISGSAYRLSSSMIASSLEASDGSDPQPTPSVMAIAIATAPATATMPLRIPCLPRSRSRTAAARTIAWRPRRRATFPGPRPRDGAIA